MGRGAIDSSGPAADRHRLRLRRLPALIRPGLIVAAFAPIGGSDADIGLTCERLSSIWEATSRLGMDEPLLDDLTVDFPDLPRTDEPAFTVLAGRNGSDEAGVSQAYLFARHDVVGLCVALASSSDDPGWDVWPRMLATWRRETGDGAAPAASLGEAWILTGHVAQPLSPPSDLADRVVTAAGRASLRISPRAVHAGDGRSIWSGVDGNGRRVVVALSTPESEEDLSRWLWWDGPHEAAPFLTYLLDAAKLDYERRVFDLRRRTFAMAVEELGGDLDQVLTLHRQVGLAGRTSMPGLIDAQERLIAARAASSSVVIEMTFLRALRRTVAIARHNMASHIPASILTGAEGGDGAGFFAQDQRTATWLEEQVEQDLGYAESVLQRAREAQDLTRLRLDQAMTRITRAQSRVTLMQTSLVSSLVSGLGAIAIMDLSFDPDENLRLPLLAAFMALTAFVPVLAAHWFEKFALIDHLVALLLGASAGWLSAQLIAVATGGGHAGSVVVLFAILVGAAVGRLLTWLHDRGPLPGGDTAMS